jgi:putative transposase
MSDAQWLLIQPLIPPPVRGGRPRALDMRQVVNAILYLQGNRCGWRKLPRSFPNPASVRTYYDRWRKDGTWDRVLALLRSNSRPD